MHAFDDYTLQRRFLVCSPNQKESRSEWLERSFDDAWRTVSKNDLHAFEIVECFVLCTCFDTSEVDYVEC